MFRVTQQVSKVAVGFTRVAVTNSSSAQSVLLPGRPWCWRARARDISVSLRSLNRKTLLDSFVVLSVYLPEQLCRRISLRQASGLACTSGRSSALFESLFSMQFVRVVHSFLSARGKHRRCSGGCPRSRSRSRSSTWGARPAQRMSITPAASRLRVH